MARRIVLLIVAVATLLLIALLSPDPSREETEFVARANEICRDVRTEAGAEPTPTTPAEQVDAIGTSLARNRAAEARFAALDPPAEDQAAFDELVEAIAAANDAQERYLQGFRDRDQGLVDSAAAEITTAQRRFVAARDALELTDCPTTVG